MSSQLRCWGAAVVLALTLAASASVVFGHVTTPTNVVVTGRANTSINLDWAYDYSDAYSGYYVRVNAGSRIAYSASQGRVTGLQPGTSYSLCVTINYTSSSRPDESNPACITTSTTGTAAEPTPTPTPTSTPTPTPTPTATPTPSGSTPWVSVSPGTEQGVFYESNGYIGPFVDGNGNLYTILERTDPQPAPAVYKSTDGGQTWVDTDAAGGPQWSTWGDLESMSVVQGPGAIYALNHRGGTSLEFFEFRTSDYVTTPDRWQAPVKLTASASAQQQAASLVRRSDGSLVAFYRSGTSIGYRVRSTGGTWGAQQTITVAKATLSGPQAVVGEGGLIRLFINDMTNDSLRYYTLNAAGILTGSTTIATGLKSAGQDNAIVSRPLYVDDNGTERIYVAYLKNADSRLYGKPIVDGVVGREEAITTVPVGYSEGSTTSFSPVAGLAANGTELHMFYADDATLDLWHTVRDSSNGTWGAASEIRNNAVIEYVNANLFASHPTAGRAIGLLVSDRTNGSTNGLATYTHVQVSATPTPTPVP